MSSTKRTVPQSLTRRNGANMSPSMRWCLATRPSRLQGVTMSSIILGLSALLAALWSSSACRCLAITQRALSQISGRLKSSRVIGLGNTDETLLQLWKGSRATRAWLDRFYSARPEQLNRQIRDELSDTVILSTQDSRPILPNFFLEVKSPEESAAVAKRQACYDGALGARAMQSLQSYREAEPVYDSNAYTITSTYHDGQLKLYSSHPNPTKLFWDGAAAYRNARDWAKERRDQFIKAVNGSEKEFQRSSSSTLTD
ncbi:hypothetical protein ACJ73_03164 [Blastomyces percursus]|uniref:Uncharacterized protein n=1 Tax=Blastomyces percursus TaxID=1658174 RepID=A0A1J9RBX3_9EURO|nr:hypothetical protein ACJ73_03164 [Blastomyces percursus]